MVIKEVFEFTSPLDTRLWAAGIRARGDPEYHVVEWTRREVPLGMTVKTRTNTRGRPIALEDAPIMDILQGTYNYSSFYGLIQAAEEEIGRCVEKGFAVIKDRGWLIVRFGTGAASRMVLIQRTKDDGRAKNRVIVDMLRSGGYNRALVPKRLVLPRVADVVESARGLWAAYDEYVEMAKKEGWLLEREQEVSNCICTGFKEDEVVMYTALLFRFRAAPPLMARLSALVSCFLQSLDKEKGVFRLTWTSPGSC